MWCTDVAPAVEAVADELDDAALFRGAAAAGPSEISTPSASSNSELPHRLDTERLPCFATWQPAAAATNMLAVETLKVPEASPPVPTISTALSRPLMFTPAASSRITEAAERTAATMVPISTATPLAIKPMSKEVRAP